VATPRSAISMITAPWVSGSNAWICCEFNVGFADARVGQHTYGRRRTVSVTCVAPGGPEPDS
jgi:hypothetical protein